MQTQPGFFMTIEGSEGVGKTSMLKAIVQLLHEQSITHWVTREPGGTPVAEKLRNVLLQAHDEPLTLETELLLLFAARAQHIAHGIRPALAEGKWVISDRFTDASYAYQAGGRGMPATHIGWLETMVQAGLQPNMTVLLDAPIEICEARMAERGRRKDRFEQEGRDFFVNVRHAYLDRAAQFPERFFVMDASRPFTEVLADVSALIMETIKTWRANA